MTLRWRFPIGDGGKIRGCSSGDDELFKKMPYALFGREILQNSIDVVQSDEESVRVVFEEFEIPTKEIPGIEQYKKQVELCKEYFKFSPENLDFCERILSKLNNGKINVLRISDFNTSGLRGIERTTLENNNFLAITKGTGVSIKPGVVSAGSKGVGKNAAINLSGIRMVFYATNTIDGYKGSLGVSELITGYVDDEAAKNHGAYTQGSGYYEDADNDVNVVSNIITFQSGYKERELKPGTDIYIMGFEAEDGWEKEVVNSALDSFMAAFVRGKLEIKVNDIEINQEELGNVVESDVILPKFKANIVSQYRLLKGASGVHTYDIDTDYGVLELLILPYKKEEEYLATHVCTMIRHPLMKIKNFDLGKNIQASAICIIGDDELGRKLRSIENPQHNDWEPKRFKDKSERKEIVAVLNFIQDEINRYVIECLQLGSDSPLDPYGAGDFLPEDSFGDEHGKADNQKVETEKTVISKKKPNVTRPKPGVAVSDNPGDEGLQPIIGGIDESEDGPIMHPADENSGSGGPSHPGAETSQEKEGDSEIFKKANLKVVKFNVICLNKTAGLYNVVFTPLEDKDDCYFRIVLLDDVNGKNLLPIKSIKLGDKELEMTQTGYGPFSVKANTKTTISLVVETNKQFGSGVTVLC
jgi:hypothetical protein